VGGASEGLGQLAALLSSAGGEVVLVASDFPSEHASQLAADLAEQTAPLGWAPYRAPSDRSASGHIVSLRHRAAAADQVQAALASQHKINTSSRAGGIRVSLHAYNSSGDIRALAQALAAVAPR